MDFGGVVVECDFVVEGDDVVFFGVDEWVDFDECCVFIFVDVVEFDEDVGDFFDQVFGEVGGVSDFDGFFFVDICEWVDFDVCECFGMFDGEFFDFYVIFD